MVKILSSILVVFLISLMFVSATAVDTCTDNDSANDIYIKGTVILNGTPHVDQCDGSSDNLKQYNCKQLSDDHYQTDVSNTQCEYGCEDGVCLTENEDDGEDDNDDSWCKVEFSTDSPLTVCKGMCDSNFPDSPGSQGCSDEDESDCEDEDNGNDGREECYELCSELHKGQVNCLEMSQETCAMFNINDGQGSVLMTGTTCADENCQNPTPQVPEFSTTAAGISLAGAAAGFIFLRRKK
jgi:hypothetical protein